MQNSYNLPDEQFKRIQSLSGEQLKAAGRKLGGTQQQNEDEIREAVARHIAQGGDMETLFERDERGVNR